VLSGISIGWATVGLIDKDSGRALPSRQYRTVTNTEPSTRVAAQLLTQAANGGIKALDLDEAAQELAIFRNETKRKK